jgi:hypothetical protein
VVSIVLGASAFATLLSVGAILAILRPANAVGWLFLLSGVGFILGIFATEYVGRSRMPGADLPAADVVELVGIWAGLMAIGSALIFVPLLFPDGRPPGQGWRVFGWASAILLVVSTLQETLQTTGLGPVIPALGVLAFASLAIRFQRSRGVERQQLKWFLLAVAVFLVTLVVGVVTELDVVWSAVLIAFASLPISAAVAVLRYRLYEIDRIISRTITYGAVTVTLTIVFVGAVIGLQTVLDPIVGGNTIAVAGSTLVVAALFQPLRGRIQRVVDRRFDRARYDAERTAAGFADRLRDEVDLDSLTEALEQTVDRAVRPAATTVWLADRATR